MRKPVPKPGVLRPVQVRLKAELYEQVRAEAKALDRSANWVINKKLEDSFIGRQAAQ